jgi:hypothetical protein
MQEIVQKMLNSNIRTVFVQVGNWNQTGSTVKIDYWWTSKTMEDTINAIKSYSNNQIEVHAWVIWSDEHPTDLNNPNIRSQAVSAAVSCVNTYGFDGFNDDMIEQTPNPSNGDYVAFVNALGTAMHNADKKASTDLPALYVTDIPTLYGGITNLDYVCPMLYDSEGWYENWIDDQIGAILQNSNVPVLVGMTSYKNENGRGISLAQQLEWIGHPTDSKFMGISIWSLAYMKQEEWSAWDNWAHGIKSTTSSCSGTSIGQDGCSSGTCCCSGTSNGCSILNYPTDRWQRVWYDFNTGECLGNGPDETNVQFDDNWGTGTLAYGKSDYIKFTSSRTIYLPKSGTYTFTVGSDDGVIFWIDGQLLIDNWVQRSFANNTVSIYLAAGSHKFRLDYYEDWIDARFTFSYTSPESPVSTCDSTCKEQNFAGGICRTATSENQDLIQNPSSWRFVAGPGSAYFTPEDEAQHVMALGANGAYVGVMTDVFYSVDGITLPNGATQKSHVVRFANEIHRLGGLIHMQNTPWSEDGLGWIQWDHNIINNVNGKQDEYIEWAKKSVQDIQPDIVQIMNEVIGDVPNEGHVTTDGHQLWSGDGTPQLWANYVAFANRYMAEVSKVKPNVVFSISSIPFWKLGEIADVSFNVPAGSRLIYDYHYYYAFDGVRPDKAHYGYDITEQLPYWDGDYSLGKQLSYSNWLDNAGLGALLDHGKTIFWEEQGTSLIAMDHGGEAWMRDVIDFCNQHGIGFGYLDNTGNCAQFGNWGYYLPYNDEAACVANGGEWSWNHSPASFWNNHEWKLNRIGQVWQQYATAITSTATCQSGETLVSDNCPSSQSCCCQGTSVGCSILSYPSDRWQRVWYRHSTTGCFGDRPDQASVQFDDDWSTGTVAHGAADDIDFISSRKIYFPTSGTYTFTIGSDDGATLYIDGNDILNRWYDRAYTEDSVDAYLTAGNHAVRLDFYENGGDARLTFGYILKGATSTCDSECKALNFVGGNCLTDGISSMSDYTGVGGDYLLYYNSGSVSAWTEYNWTSDDITYNGHIDISNKYWKPMGFTIDKILFSFLNEGVSGSKYDETKFAQVLDMFDQRGIKVIPALYPDYDASYNLDYYDGSPQLKADWLAFTKKWKGDSRIAAFNIYGEPTGATDNGMGSGQTWYSGIKSRKNLAIYFVDLVKSIHAIDPNRVVIYPYLGLSYWNPQELFDDIESTGIFQEPNTIFDVTHPYYFDIHEWNEGDPVQKALDYESREIVPWIDKVGSSKVWCGETFMFVGYAQGFDYKVDLNKQKEFFVEMLNIFEKDKVGFNVLGGLSASPHYVSTYSGDQVSWNDFHTKAIKESNFKPSDDTSQDICSGTSINQDGCSSGTCCCS